MQCPLSLPTASLLSLPINPMHCVLSSLPSLPSLPNLGRDHRMDAYPILGVAPSRSKPAKSFPVVYDMCRHTAYYT